MVAGFTARHVTKRQEHEASSVGRRLPYSTQSPSAASHADPGGLGKEA